MSNPTGSVSLTPVQKLSENVSIRDFGGKGDDTTDNTDALLAAITWASSVGGAKVYLPRGTYLFKTSTGVDFPGTTKNVLIYGDSEGTIVKRGVALDAGKGLWNLAGTGVTLSDISFEGAKTTPTGVVYGTFSNPMDNALTGDTTIWVQPGSSRLLFNNVTIRHTGGYSIIFDSRTGDISDVTIKGGLLENCRPHNFGDTGDTVYGGWTGGIIVQGDCRASAGHLYAMKGLTLDGMRFNRMAGNCFWQHCYGFDVQHENFVVQNCRGQYLGRDMILIGNVKGGSVCGNSADYVGFCTYTDSDTPVGRAYMRGVAGVQYAVGLDSSGYVENVTYADNVCTNVFGGGIDLDGFRNGAVMGNSVSAKTWTGTCDVSGTAVTWASGDKFPIMVSHIDIAGTGYYVTGQSDDQTITLASTGGTQTGAAFNVRTLKGIQTGDTSLNGGGVSVKIIDNHIDDCNAGGIVLNQARGCLCDRNTINAASVSGTVPIVLYSKDLKCYGNTVRSNLINWAQPGWAIIESDDGDGTGFDATIINNVYGNVISTNLLGEFLAYQYPVLSGTPTITSSSKTGITLSSNSPILTQKNSSFLQREGIGVTSALKLYDTQGGTTKQYMQHQFANGIVNYSINGAAGTGGILLSNRTTLGYEDVFWGGKLMTDGFLAIFRHDGTSTTFSDTDADMLSDDWALIRWNKTLNKWEQSTTISSGARVWADFAGSGGGSISGLTAGRVPFASGTTSLADSNKLYWDNTHKVLYADSVAATTALTIGNGTGSSVVLGLVNAYLLATAATASTPTAAQGHIYFDGTRFKVSENGGSFIDLTGGRLTGLTAGRIPYTTSATAIADSANLAWDNTLHLLTITGVASYAGISCINGFIQSDGGFLTLSSNLYAIQAPNGGVLSMWSIVKDSVILLEEAAPLGSGAGQSRIYMDSTSKVVRMSRDTGTYHDIITSSANLTSGRLPYISGQSTLADTGNLLWNNSTQRLSLTGIANSVSLEVFGGYVTSDQGFAVTSSTQTDSIKALTSGVTAKWLIGKTSLTLIDDTAAHAGLSDAYVSPSSPGDGRIYFDSTLHKFMLSENGGAYTQLANPISGLTAGRIPYASSATGLADSANLTWDNANALLYLPAGKIRIGTTSMGGSLDSTGPVYIQTASASGYALVARGSASQTYNLAEFRDSSNNSMMAIDKTGSVVISNTPALGVSSSYGTYGADRIQFKQQSGDDSTAGTIIHRPSGGSSMEITGGGTSPNRKVLAKDTLIAGTALWVNRTTDDGSGGAVQVIGYVSTSTGYYTPSTATDAVKVLSGGVSARWLIGTTSLTILADSAYNAGLSSGYGTYSGRIYFDSSTHKFRVSEGGGAYVDLIGSGGGGLAYSGLASTYIPYCSSSSAVIGSAYLWWDNPNLTLRSENISANKAAAIGNLSSDGALGMIRSYIVFAISPSAPTPVSGQCYLYWDGTKLKISENGGSYVNVA